MIMIIFLIRVGGFNWPGGVGGGVGVARHRVAVSIMSPVYFPDPTKALLLQGLGINK